MSKESAKSDGLNTRQHPFRRAVLRGLGVVLPPLLTVVLFIWAWAQIENYVLSPLEGAARWTIVLMQPEVLDDVPKGTKEVERDAADQIVRFRHNDVLYASFMDEDGHVTWVPTFILEKVRATKRPGDKLPVSAGGYYRTYVQRTYLSRTIVIPVFLCVFVLALYLLGKFLAAGVGRMAFNLAESVIHRLPVIRNVYSSVKQVTDFVFSEQEVQFTRVVAVQYPRRGLWSLGFVTGESMVDIRAAANEPVLSILMPTSPMPMTGFTVTVPKSETIDLDISIDQAIQFVVSCGVVIPSQQLPSGSPGIVPPVAGSIEGNSTGDHRTGNPSMRNPSTGDDSANENVAVGTTETESGRKLEGTEASNAATKES